MAYERECCVAVESVVRACRFCQSVQARLHSGGVLGKEDGSPVTVADFGSQALISAHLSRHFPQEVIVGEEVADQLRTPGHLDLKEEVIRHVRIIEDNLSPAHILEAIDRGAGSPKGQGRYWTVDPIDGTKGFIRGDQYAVALALLEQNEVVLAVLGCPNLPLVSLESFNEEGCIFVAVMGEGAVMMGL